MVVKVRFFAVLRERAGVTSAELAFDRPPSVNEAWELLQQQYPALGPFRECVTFAVNRQYVDSWHPLHDGDELALIPPVSGGCDGEDC